MNEKEKLKGQWKDNPFWVRPPEVGELLGLNWARLKPLLVNGNIPAVFEPNERQFGGGRWKIPRKSIMEYIEAQEQAFIEEAEAQAAARRKNGHSPKQR
jgi:hypothetical protein